MVGERAEQRGQSGWLQAWRRGEKSTRAYVMSKMILLGRDSKAASFVCGDVGVDVDVGGVLTRNAARENQLFYWRDLGMLWRE